MIGLPDIMIVEPGLLSEMLHLDVVRVAQLVAGPVAQLAPDQRELGQVVCAAGECRNVAVLPVYEAIRSVYENVTCY